MASADIPDWSRIVTLIFAWLGWANWHMEEIQQLVPLTTHGPLIFWTIPVRGVRDTSSLLDASQWTFGLLFLSFWDKRLEVLGALGSTATFFATVTIFPFARDGWMRLQGKGPSMSITSAFLFKQAASRLVSARTLR